MSSNYPPGVTGCEPYIVGASICRGCGCTDHDCGGCIERTGQPCGWVEDDLCSACGDAMCEAVPAAVPYLRQLLEGAERGWVWPLKVVDELGGVDRLRELVRHLDLWDEEGGEG